jgi:hypothetical protein
MFFHKLVSAYMTTRRHIPEDNMNKHCREGLQTFKCRQNFCSNIRRKPVRRWSRHTLDDNIKIDCNGMRCGGVRWIWLRIGINGDLCSDLFPTFTHKSVTSGHTTYKNLRGFSPPANHTDRATAACR